MQFIFPFPMVYFISFVKIYRKVKGKSNKVCKRRTNYVCQIQNFILSQTYHETVENKFNTNLISGNVQERDLPQYLFKTILIKFKELIWKVVSFKKLSNKLDVSIFFYL